MSDAKAAPLAALHDFLFRLAQAGPETWADRLRDDQRRRWLAGARVCVEDYVEGLPGLSEHAEALLDLVYGEVLLREEAGEHPQLAELQERFPAYRDALARQWEVHLVLEDSSLRQTRGAPRSLPDTRVSPSGASKAVSSASETLPGTRTGQVPVIPGYDILEELGRGGNGVVYLARQRSLNRLVAIKMITPDRELSGALVSRIRSEAELIARLQHPHIVSIFRVGLHENKPFLVLEYVPGGSLAQRLDGGRWPAADATALVETLARTLAVVHEQGIVHRDLKPANVLLAWSPGNRDGTDGTDGTDKAHRPHPSYPSHSVVPKIVDFGLAKTLIDAEPTSDRAVTMAGELVGTPLYMAPEQATGQNDRIGPATDQHALGVILYEMLAGEPPIKAENAFDMLAHVAFTMPVPPSQRVKGISADLDAVVMRCLAIDPRQRYASTLELAEDLYRVRRGFPSRARQVGTFERMRMWSRRQPVVAGLTLAVFMALLFGVVTFAIQWRRAEAALTSATSARAEAEEARDREADAHQKESDARKEIARKNLLLHNAFEQSQRVLARSLVALAETERIRNNLARAQEHLAECPPEARAWEWYYLSRRCSMRLQTLDGPADDVFVSAAISPDGLWLAGAVASGTRSSPAVRLWKAGSARLARTLEGSACVAFHPSGTWLATCGQSGGLLLYSLSALKSAPMKLMVPKQASEKYLNIGFSPDGRYLAAQNEDALKVWELSRAGRPLAVAPVPLPQTIVSIRAIAFRPDNKVLAVAGRKQVIFWDLVHRRFLPPPSPPRGGDAKPPHLHILYPEKNGIFSTLAWVGPSSFVTGTSGGSLRIYDFNPKSVTFAHRLEGHAGGIEGLSIAGGLLASVSSDGTTRVWDLKSRQEIVRLPGFRAVAMDAHGERLLSAGRDRRLAVWRARPTPPAARWAAPFSPILALAFSPDSKVLATATNRGVVRFHDPRTLEPKEKKEKEKNEWHAPERVLALAYHPGGRLLAVGLARGSSPTLVIWHVPSGRRVVLSGHSWAVASVAFSPDGKYLVTGGGRGVIQLWQGPPDDPTWKPVRKLQGHTRMVSGLAFGPRGELASTARDGKVVVWNVQSGKVLREVQVRPDVPDKVDAGKQGMGLPFPGIAFSPDGKLVATGGLFGGDSADSAPGVVILNVETGEERKLVGHMAGVLSLAFSPDGLRLATSGRDGAVRLWDPSRGEEILTLNGDPRSALALRFSPDGRFLAVSSWDRTVVVHEGQKSAAR